jgi:hypothetical protein
MNSAAEHCQPDWPRNVIRRAACRCFLAAKRLESKAHTNTAEDQIRLSTRFKRSDVWTVTTVASGDPEGPSDMIRHDRVKCKGRPGGPE